MVKLLWLYMVKGTGFSSHSSIQITLDSYATVIDELMINNVRALKEKLSNQDEVDNENNPQDEH